MVKMHVCSLEAPTKFFLIALCIDKLSEKTSARLKEKYCKLSILVELDWAVSVRVKGHWGDRGDLRGDLSNERPHIRKPLWIGSLEPEQWHRCRMIVISINISQVDMLSLVPRNNNYPSIHSFIQPTFTEDLLHTRHCEGPWQESKEQHKSWFGG